MPQALPLKPGFIHAKNKIQFNNLDGARGIAALAVVISHIELHKELFGFKRFSSINLCPLGPIAVTFFFVLSGFLITYLLLEENREFKKISYRNFYLRRLLRIWPLYYLVILVGFFIYPASGSMQGFWLSALFLPNLAFCLQLLPAIFDPVWSIGTEEQFYLFHPHFFRFRKVKHIFYAMLVFVLCFYSVDRILKLFEHTNRTIPLIRLFLQYARFDNMIAGALFAIFFYNRKHQIKEFWLQPLFDKLFNKSIQLITLLVFIIMNTLVITVGLKLVYQVECVFSGIIIVNLCEAGTCIYSLDFKPLKFLGKISYGIYLTHKFSLFGILYVAGVFFTGSSATVVNIVLYTGTIVCSVLIATISYNGYEKYFLNIKKKFYTVSR